MKPFIYSMPTKLYAGANCIDLNKDAFRAFGKKAFLITCGVAEISGSKKSVVSALDAVGISYVVFDKVEENPSRATIEEATKTGIAEKVDFVIGIGGGSPMDAAKMAAILIKNPDKTADDLFKPEPALSALPFVCVPTTAGTGSEVTPFAVMTDHNAQTKRPMLHFIYANAAFLDATFMMSLPDVVTINTAIDALTHMIESYFSAKANFMSDRFSEMGFPLFAETIDNIKKRNFPLEVREKLLLASAIGGIAFAQSSISLPHRMGYGLTYYKNIPHGKASGMLTIAYLEIIEDKAKLNNMLRLLNFKDFSEMADFFNQAMEIHETFDEAFINQMIDIFMSSPANLAVHPSPVTREDIYNIYAKSLL